MKAICYHATHFSEHFDCCTYITGKAHFSSLPNYANIMMMFREELYLRRRFSGQNLLLDKCSIINLRKRDMEKVLRILSLLREHSFGEIG